MQKLAGKLFILNIYLFLNKIIKNIINCVYNKFYKIIPNIKFNYERKIVERPELC